MNLIPYLHLVYNFLFFLLGWKFGDWKNWRRYYPTILFFIAGDLVHNFVSRNFILWEYQGAIPPNHILIALLIMFVAYPATVLIYLKNSTKGIKPFIFQYILWVSLYTIIEFINLHLGLISHHNGWSIWWSLMMNLILFITLRIHFNRPLWARVIYAATAFWISIAFGIPIKG